MNKWQKGSRVGKYQRERLNRFADLLLWILANEKAATEKLSGGFISAKTEMEYLNAFRFSQQIRFSIARGEKVNISQYKGREREFGATIARIKAEGQQQRIFNH